MLSDRQNRQTQLVKNYAGVGKFEVWRSWRDTMLKQGREVKQDLLYIETIPAIDLELDKKIAEDVVNDFLVWVKAHIGLELTIPNSQHIYYSNDSDGPKINVKVEKNSKGYNYEATVTNCSSVTEALGLMKEAMDNLKKVYGGENA